MTRWIAAGAITAAAIYGLNDGHNIGDQNDPNLVQPDPSPTNELTLSRDDLFTETATHEAGHVTVARNFGIPVWETSADDLGNGDTVYPDHYFRDPQRDAYDYAVIDAAGEEAAMVWLAQHGYTHDQALAEAEPHARSDLNQLEVDARQAGISTQQAHDRARRIVLDHQDDINRTAQRLIERGGYLDEYELEH